MSYIDAFYPPAPEAETVIAYYDVDFLFIDNSFYPSVLSKYMIITERVFSAKGNILR